MKIIIAFIFAPIVSFSQTLDLNWASQLENADETSWGWGSEIDDSDNVYHFGSFGGEVDFDPGADTHIEDAGSSGNAFIQKLDKDGNFLLVLSIEATGFSKCHALTSDEDGNIYASFDYRGTMDCDAGPGEALLESSASGYTSSALAKYDVDGNFIWAKNFTTFTMETYGIDYHDGFIATTGHFQGTLDFDPGPGEFLVSSTIGADFFADIFILKLDADGNFVWAKTAGNGYHHIGRDVDFDSDGNLLTTGQFNGTLDLDFGPDVSEVVPHPEDYPEDATSGDIYFLKIDADGNYIWSFAFGNAYHDDCREITLDSDGNMYAVGHFYDDVDMDPSDEVYTVSSNWGTQDIFALKISADKELMWAHAFGGTGDDSGIALALGSNDHPFFAGSFNYEADFDPSAGEFILESSAGADGFILELDEEGNFVGAGQIESSGILMYDLEGDSEGRIIAVGRIGSSTDFDMSAEAFILTPEGSANAFVVSYLGDVCGSIDLTVTELDFVLTAAEEDVDYQWIDCDQDDAIIPGATEQNYAPDVNGNFAVILTNELCVDTSDCIAVSGLGVIDNIPVNFSIVPNPSNGQFEIRLNGFNSSLANNLTIMDLSGKIIYNMTIPSGQKISSLIDLSNFESGIYIVTIESEENRITEKLELIK